MKKSNRNKTALEDAKNANNTPMKKKTRQISIPADWQETPAGYTYEKTISQVKTKDIIIKKVLKGSIIANHAILSLCTYRKDVGELLELEKTERLLEAELDEGVISDTEYLKKVPIIGNKLLKIREKIRAIKRDSVADVEKTLLEDWYSGDLKTDEHIEWQEKFMQKASAVNFQ